MSGRNRLALVLGLGLALGACASGGASSGETSTPSASSGSNTQTREYAPGTKPSDNRYTRSAKIYLDKGESAQYPDEAQKAYQDALEQARLSIQDEPGNARGYYQAGVALVGLGQLAEAGQMFDKAEEIYPAYAEETRQRRQRAWVNTYNAAVQALQAGNEDEAVQQMQLADQIYAGRPEARLNLAIIYTNRGEYEKAIDWYRKTLDVLSGDEVQYLSAEQKADWADKRSTAIFNLAQVLNRLDRADEAIQLYRTYLQDHPDDATVKVQLALALTRQGDDAAAADLFSEVLSREDLTPEQYYQVGVGLFNASRFAGAATAFERAVAANPYFRDAVFNLSQALLAHSNEIADDAAAKDEFLSTNERMVAVTNQLVELDPLNRNAYAILVQGYRALKENTSGATSQGWSDKLNDLVNRYQALPVEISDVSLNRVSPQAIALNGKLTNLTLGSGTPVQLEFSLLNASGSAIATQNVTVTTSAKGEATPFNAQFAVQGEVAGWKYHRVQ